MQFIETPVLFKNQKVKTVEEIKKQKIMVIDDNITNLNIARKALEEHYDVMLIPSGEKALKVLEKNIPDLILLDVEMPGMSGFEFISIIKKADTPLSEIPIIFVTAKDDSSSEYEGLDLGAVDYITKPFSFPLLLKRVSLHLKLTNQQQELQNYSANLEVMVTEKTKVIQELQYAVVEAMSDMVERRDGSTGGHITRTKNYLKILLDKAKEDNIYNGSLQSIDSDLYSHASQLHDVGKISIPDSILLKPGRLTEEEFEVMKYHTVYGEEAINDSMHDLKDIEFLKVASEFAKSHHEKWDGSGYPQGLAGENIPISGRLMAIVDVYDAVLSKRPYKEAFTHTVACDIIKKDSGKHFDPELVKVFISIADVFRQISES